MGDNSTLTKDKHPRSSVSLLGAAQAKKLSKTASKPELDDQFAIAEARCGELQQKIDLVKALKRRKKMKKRSLTKMADAGTDSVPVQMVTVRAKPKRGANQQAPRKQYACPDLNAQYSETTAMEQHRMLQNYNHSKLYTFEEEMPIESNKQKSWSPRVVRRKIHNEDEVAATTRQRSSKPTKVGSAQEHIVPDEQYHEPIQSAPVRKRLSPHIKSTRKEGRKSPTVDLRTGSLQGQGCIEGVVELFSKENVVPAQETFSKRAPKIISPTKERAWIDQYNRENAEPPQTEKVKPPKRDLRKKKQSFSEHIEIGKEMRAHDSGLITSHIQHYSTELNDQMNFKKRLRKGRLRLQRYEMPTVSSQLKASTMRIHPYAVCTQATKIPFVASKSCAPSHNIGVNLQQVLNGLKMQQPIGGIPLTIAHHMGKAFFIFPARKGHLSSVKTGSKISFCFERLRHLPYVTKSEANTQTVKPTLDVREINVIHLGDRLLHLPSYKFMSYRRLLEMYKEGDGMVPRFLKAKNKPTYLYTTMYNLAQNHGDAPSTTSKIGEDTKQLLGEYATLYSEFEHLEKNIKDGDDNPDLKQRRDNLVKFLAAREEQIRRVTSNTVVAAHQDA